MAPMGGLLMLFKAEEEEQLRRQLALANERSERSAARSRAKLVEMKKKNIINKKPATESEFRMPLHYPSYTKTQYENMSEWEIDLLLKQYGLFVDGHDLRYKKDFAINAFLWDLPAESSTDHPPTSGSSSSTCRDVQLDQELASCCSRLMEKSGITQPLMVFFSLLGFA